MKDPFQPAFRPLTSNDEALVWHMLMLAAHEPTLEATKSQAILAPYAEGWGQAGDTGFVALDRDQPVGAIWLRLWTATRHGFGYVDEVTPEMAMAVVPHYQGQGIGTQLLALLLEHVKDAYPAVSLSVRADNPALRLYERAGFINIAGSEKTNRVGSISFNMIRRLA